MSEKYFLTRIIIVIMFYMLSGNLYGQIKLTAEDGAEEDRFGVAISISGDNLISGAWYDDDNGENSGSAYVFHNQNGMWSQSSKLIPDDGDTHDHFGVSVSISGDYAVIGASLADDRKGSAYIFKNINGIWTQQLKLSPTELVEGDYFGCAVEIDVDNVVIGARGDGQQGAAYIFSRNGEAWEQQIRLQGSEQHVDDWFGNSVAIDNDYVLVGARRANEVAGAVYVFKNENGVWSEKQRLVGEFLQNDSFGLSVSIHDDRAAIGAWGDDVMGEGAGSAYVFTRTGENWTMQQKLVPSDGERDDHFGYDVSIENDYLAVGTVNLWTEDNSACYLYKFDGITWNEIQKFTSEEEIPSNSFGGNALIEGSTLVISDDYNNSKTGAVYVYNNFQQTLLTSMLFDNDSESGDGFGSAIDRDGNTIIVGAMKDSELGSDDGSVYFFDKADDGWIQSSKVYSAFNSDGDYFGSDAAISGDYAIVGAHKKNDETGCAYIFKRNGNIWSEQTTLLPDDVQPGDNFGSVDIFGDYAVVGASKQNSRMGAAYIFQRAGEDWNQKVKLSPSGGGYGDYLGSSVSINEDLVIVSALGSSSYRGTAYIFRRNGIDEWVEEAKLEPYDGSNNDQFGVSVDISGNYAVVGANNDDDQGENSGSAYVYKYENGNWVFDQKLKAPDGGAEKEFGKNVSIHSDFIAVANQHSGEINTCYVFKKDDIGWTEVSRYSSAAVTDNYAWSIFIDDEVLLVGDITFEDKGAVFIHTDFNQNNKAIRFESPGDYVEIPFSTELNPEEFTVEFLLRVNGLGDISNGYAEQNIIDSRDGENGYNFRVYDTSFPLSLDAVIGEANHIQIENIIQQNTWHHIAATCINLEVKLYVDGHLQRSVALQQPFNTNTISNFRLGEFLGYPAAYLGIEGDVDELRIWNYARSDAEIFNTMNSSLSGVEEGLAGYWKFNNILNSIVEDKSGNGHHGIVNGNCLLMETETILTDVDEFEFEVPTNVTLFQNYPNPFNPSTTISYSLPEQSEITLIVYDVLGRKVTTLFDGVRNAGVHSVTFNANKLASGIYFYQIISKNNVFAKRMLFLK